MTKKQRNKETKKQEKNSSVQSKAKGFTLIELLVVVAIIGILASIVIASLGRAREQGQNAKIKAALSNAKVQAELYFSVNGDYDGVCDDDVDGIEQFFDSAVEASPNPTNSSCVDEEDSWVMAVELNSCACVSSADLGLIEIQKSPCKVRGSPSSYSCAVIGKYELMGLDPEIGIAARCGDGIINQFSEECDDSNTQSGDGCSSTCKIEGGFVPLPS